MLTYPKIETLYNRDPENFKVTDELRLPEFDLIKKWHVTEKIDGTNIRVRVYPGGTIVGIVAAGDEIPTEVTFHGRTDKADIPKFLLAKLEEMFPPEKFDKIFTGSPTLDEVILFGEGYRAKIQKGGGNYREGVSFRLFDVAIINEDPDVPPLWLEWENVEDIAESLGIKTVPVLSDWFSPGWPNYIDSASRVAQEDGGAGCTMEGIVARTTPLLHTRRGDRLMWKLKGKDF